MKASEFLSVLGLAENIDYKMYLFIADDDTLLQFLILYQC